VRNAAKRKKNSARPNEKAVFHTPVKHRPEKNDSFLSQKFLSEPERTRLPQMVCRNAPPPLRLYMPG
jgi:hypothetical protein